MKKVSAPAAEEEARPEPAAPRPRYKLNLDHDDVYFGCEPIAPGEDPAAGDIVLDHAPDNAPGQYRWLREEKKFHALGKAQQKTVQGAPTLEQAFYDFVKYGADTPRVEAWCAWFEKTIEAPSRPPKGNQS